jgi:integrase
MVRHSKRWADLQDARRYPFVRRDIFSSCEDGLSHLRKLCRIINLQIGALCRCEISIRHKRHTFSTLLKGNGEDVKVVQELLRYSTARMTLDTYTQALSPQKRAAQSKVVGMIKPKPSCTVVVPRVSGEIEVTH